MMSDGKIPTLFLLSVMVSSQLHLFANASTDSTPASFPPTKFITSFDIEDFEDELEQPEVISTMRTTVLHRNIHPCKYNPCLENQLPCAQISAETGCLCPGFSGADQRPHAPFVKTLMPMSEGADKGKVTVHWCAPSSVVSQYRVEVEGRENDNLEFGAGLRYGLVGTLEAGTKVCVQAVNKAGHSELSEFSCKRYELPESSNHNILSGVIGGGIALLLLIVITAVIIWRHQLYKKAKRDNSNGLGNPSYSTEEAL